MPNCKECFHYDACNKFSKNLGLPTTDELGAYNYCGCYKNAADVVEVVRCKDCVHHDDCICVVCEEGETVVCKRESRHVPKEFSCIYGKRRETDGHN